MKRIIVLLLSIHIWAATAIAQELPHAKEVLKLMGCRFELTAIAETEQQAQHAIQKGVEEIQRIEQLISSWNPATQTSSINQMAGIEPVKVEEELFQLIVRAKKVSGLTDGAFDISFASMDRIWQFDGKEHDLPAEEIVAKASAKINWENIVLDTKKQTVFLKEAGMKIGFGAIGKGYAANRAKAIMQTMPGVKGGAVNASGDLLTWGKTHNHKDWTVQIADPQNKDVSLGWITINDMAIVTSGDYEKYFTHQGKRYAHIINPKTGYPTTELKSVSIICPDAELADALATSVFVLGSEKGLALVNQLNFVECIIITHTNEVLTSANLQLNYFP